MCWKKIVNWWNNLNVNTPDPEPVPESRKTALLFGINKYGSPNNLMGCLNDINDVSKKLQDEFPGFNIKLFKDAEVTKKSFLGEMKKAILALQPGDNVVIKFDSCFSEGATREINSNTFIKKFIDPGYPKGLKVRKKIIRSEDLNCLFWSGCMEHETSADAYINGRFNGAFTYCDLKSMIPGTTYEQEYQTLLTYLPGNISNQTPTIFGTWDLLHKKIFADPTLLIWFSGHGSFVIDQNGDESDGYDEVICVMKEDGSGIDYIIDDEIHEILKLIP
jgi:hypothetical protein